MVEVNNHAGSPFQGLVFTDGVVWCLNVTIRLMITVFCELVDEEDGYFMNLLGGPKVRRTNAIKRHRKPYRIDNRPTRGQKAKDGLNGVPLLENEGEEDEDMSE